MKRDSLLNAGFSQDQVDFVMSEYGKSVESLRAACSDADSKLTESAARSAELDSLCRDLQSKLDAADASLSVKDSAISDLNDRISALDSALDTLKNNIADSIAGSLSFSSSSAKSFILDQIRTRISSGIPISDIIADIKDSDPSAFVHSSDPKPFFSSPASASVSDYVPPHRFLRKYP